MPVANRKNEHIKIAFLAMETNPWWTPVKAGVMEAKELLKEYNTEVDWIVAGDRHTADVFGIAIEAAMAQNYDGIACLAGDEGMIPFIKKAVDAGVAVATYNSETNKESARAFFIGADNYQQGRACGEKMAQLIGGKGKVAIITGFFAVEAHELRRTGFKDILSEKYPEITIAGEVENIDLADIAYTQATDFMSSFPDLAGIYITASGQFGAANAVKDYGKKGLVKVVCHDFLPETMGLVKEGVIQGVIDQSTKLQGRDTVIRLYNYIAGGIVPPFGKLLLDTPMATPDNVNQYWPD
ncbi:MAG: sugar ABC transporter substrate-binding protein [Bacteroidales bacterium]|nr:sugar ABC transporter substrate-binding protein [Bacteroidales bacterium]